MKSHRWGANGSGNFPSSLTVSVELPETGCHTTSRGKAFNAGLAALLAVFMLWSNQAWSIAIFQYSAFVNSLDLGPLSFEDTRIGAGLNEFPGAGLGVSFTNLLDMDGFGTVSWEVTNNSGSKLSDVMFFGFLDAEIDEPQNSFFNESGALVSVTGTGAADSAADSWEIDDPFFPFGDIFDNLVDGMLDNSNNVPAGLEGDVSLALGFDVGMLLPGQSLLATFETSLANIGGLSHTDPDSDLTFYFNGSVSVQDIPSIPEPGALMLLVMGVAGLTVMRMAFPAPATFRKSAGGP